MKKFTGLVIALALAGCTTAPTTSPTASNQAAAIQSQQIEVTNLKGTLDVPAHGEGEKIPLVILMHGFNSNQDAAVLRATAQALNNSNIATIRFDFNGHGKSGGAMKDMTIPREIKDAHAIYDYARALPFVSNIGLLGHSQGGVVAAMLAGELQNDIAGLVLLAPGVMIPDNVREGNMLGTRFDPANPPESIQVFGYEVGRDYILTAQQLQIRELSARYTGPASLLQGENDPLVPASVTTEYMKTTFPTSEVHVLPNQGHDFQDAQEPAQLVTTFFSTHMTRITPN